MRRQGCPQLRTAAAGRIEDAYGTLISFWSMEQPESLKSIELRRHRFQIFTKL